MSPRPRLSLCIPTYNRALYLGSALESGLREAASQLPGTVEVLVCDNGSSDETKEVIAGIQAAHPDLRALRNVENIGFDRNYLRCVDEARGEFVWVMGDDDVWQPGSVARVLLELDAGADACLCSAEACDMDLKPLYVMKWYLDPNPPTVWNLASREDLVKYFNTCALNAGAFAFISATIFRRDRFLSPSEILNTSLNSGYIHVWGMLEFVKQPTKLHYIPEVLVRNRLSDDHADARAVTDLFGRWVQDFRIWAWIGDCLLGTGSARWEKAAFSNIVRRNHGGDSFLPRLRVSAPTTDDWLSAIPFLVRAGFSRSMIAAVDFGFRHMNTERLPKPTQDFATHGFAVLPFLAQRAKRIAIFAMTGLDSILNGAELLGALVNYSGKDRFRVYCAQECTEFLYGFDYHCPDSKRYFNDPTYRTAVIQSFKDFAPELVINLDPARGIEVDEMLASAHPVGAIAYDLPERGYEPALILALNAGYTCLVPQSAPPETMLEALGLATPGLWPTPTAWEEAQAILHQLGWEPEQVQVVLLDDPSLLDNSVLASAIAAAGAEGWYLLGIGGRGVTYQKVEALLHLWKDRSANLTGVLGLGSTVALLQLCRGHLGGTPRFRAMAKLCGSVPFHL